MTQISSVIDVTVNVADLRLSAAGFGTPLLAVLAEDTVFLDRTKVYAELSEVAVDFAINTKPWRMANAIFSQPNSPETIKIGRIEAGDANLTAALDAIDGFDPDWYALALESVLQADIEEAATWVEARTKVQAYVTEDEAVIASGSADVASILQAATRQRTFGIWHQHAGRDDTGGALVEAFITGILEVTETAHGLEVGDPIVVESSANSEITVDTQFTVLTVADANTFTFLDPAVVSADTADAITYFAGYTYANCAWLGLQLPTNPGSTTWKFKRLSGIDVSTLSDITSSEEAFALGKGINLYTLLGSLGVGFTHEAIMASGRFIDVQRSVDFMQARLSEAIAALLLQSAKINYDDAGMAIIEATIQQQMNSYVGLNILTALLDRTDGKIFLILIPKVASQLPADRANREVKGIEVQGQLAGAIHKVNITLNAQV